MAVTTRSQNTVLYNGANPESPLLSPPPLITIPAPPPSSSFRSRSPSPGSPADTSPPESPTARSRRSSPPSLSPPMSIASTPSRYTLTVDLGPQFQPEMVTISALKGDRLDVVADLWYMEKDCHHEWRVQFAPDDVDTSSARANIECGKLNIHVRRRRKSEYVSEL